MRKFILAMCILWLGLPSQSCKRKLISIENEIEPLPKLSEWEMFEGNLANLKPRANYQLYELATELYTDEAEKQRLISIPAGTTIRPVNNGLPEFPDGTVLVKTFYYYKDKRDTTKGKRIIETRILMKAGGQWNVANYLWDEHQSDARLITTSIERTINWVDQKGEGKVISYHVPGKNECTTCHLSYNLLEPIGPKMRNLNREVTRNGSKINQLQYLADKNWLEPLVPSDYTALPAWKNKEYSLQERARAYLDVNCAHCHNGQGFAQDENLNFTYEATLEESRIGQRKKTILTNFEGGDMPMLGVTTVNKEALELLRAYLETLP